MKARTGCAERLSAGRKPVFLGELPMAHRTVLRYSLVLLALFAGIMGGAAALKAADEPKPAEPATTDGNVLAVVNGENIDRDELVKVLIERYGQPEFQQLIVDTLVNQEQKKYGVEVSDSEYNDALDREVQGRIDQRKQQLMKQTQGLVKWEAYLEQVGVTEAQMRAEDRKEILAQKDADKVVRRGVVLMKLAWFNYLSHDRYDVAHIQVETEAEANDVVKQLNDGKDFAAVASERSRDQYSARAGGQMVMPFSEGDYKIRPDIPGPEFERVVMSLKPGSVSEPVKGTDGWEVIKLVAKEDAKPGNWNDLQPEVAKTLADSRTVNVVQIYIWRLLRDAKIENKSDIKLPFLDQLKEREEQSSGTKPAETPSEKPVEPEAVPAPEGGAPAQPETAPPAGGDETPAAPESGP
jgi:foldase protein PrsA